MLTNLLLQGLILFYELWHLFTWFQIDPKIRRRKVDESDSSHYQPHTAPNLISHAQKVKLKITVIIVNCALNLQLTDPDLIRFRIEL